MFVWAAIFIRRMPSIFRCGHAECDVSICRPSYLDLPSTTSQRLHYQVESSSDGPFLFLFAAAIATAAAAAVRLVFILSIGRESGEDGTNSSEIIKFAFSSLTALEQEQKINEKRNTCHVNCVSATFSLLVFHSPLPNTSRSLKNVLYPAFGGGHRIFFVFQFVFGSQQTEQSVYKSRIIFAICK